MEELTELELTVKNEEIQDERKEREEMKDQIADMAAQEATPLEEENQMVDNEEVEMESSR